MEEVEMMEEVHRQHSTPPILQFSTLRIFDSKKSENISDRMSKMLQLNKI